MNENYIYLLGNSIIFPSDALIRYMWREHFNSTLFHLKGEKKQHILETSNNSNCSAFK